MIDIFTTTKDKPDIKDVRLVFVAETVLGKKYDLTITFIGEKRAQTLNKAYRKKTYIPNILSFPLSDNEGEIYICPKIAKKEFHHHGFTYTDYIEYLVLHGCVHLLGNDHGNKMDALEQKLMRKLSLSKNTQ